MHPRHRKDLFPVTRSQTTTSTAQRSLQWHDITYIRPCKLHLDNNRTQPLKRTQTKTKTSMRIRDVQHESVTRPKHQTLDLKAPIPVPVNRQDLPSTKRHRSTQSHKRSHTLAREFHFKPPTSRSSDISVCIHDVQQAPFQWQNNN